MPTLAVKQQPGEGSDAARARKASFNQGQQPHLQAQSMYPHHPLLAGAPGQGWTSDGTAGLNGMTPPHFSNVFSSTALPGAAGNPMYANGFPPQFAVPQMGGTGSNQVMGSSSMGRGPSLGSLSSMGYEFGFKKRACDQCNHSKVRCDFSDPCCTIPIWFWVDRLIRSQSAMRATEHSLHLQQASKITLEREHQQSAYLTGYARLWV